MVQTRSQAKTTGTTTTKSKSSSLSLSTSKRKATTKPSKASSVPEEVGPLKVSTLTAKAKKASASLSKSTKTSTGRGNDEKNENENENKNERKKESQKVESVPTLATASKLFKSSLQEAPRRGRKRAPPSKKEEQKAEAKIVEKQQGADDAETAKQNKECSDHCENTVRRNGTRKVEDVGQKRETAGTNTKQKKVERGNSAAAAVVATGRGRRVAKTQSKISGSAVTAETNTSIKSTLATEAVREKRAGLQQKRAEVQIRSQANEPLQIHGQSRGRQRQAASKKVLAKEAPAASKRQKVSTTRAVVTASPSKSATNRVNTRNGKAIAVAASTSITSSIGQSDQQASHLPTPSILRSAPRRSPLKQSASGKNLIKPPTSPVRMMMAITPAKRCNDEFLEDENDPYVEGESKDNQFLTEWEKMRNVTIIEHSPVKLMARQHQSPRFSPKGAAVETSMLAGPFNKDGEETEEETEVPAGESVSKEVEPASPILSGAAATTEASITAATEVASPIATSNDTAPTPFTFKPSSLRFLTSLTPMFPTNGAADAIPSQTDENTSTNEHESHTLMKRNNYKCQLETAPQLSKTNEHVTTPSRLLSGAASFSRTPFSASAQLVTPFRPAPPMRQAATCAAGTAAARLGPNNAAPASARVSRDAKLASPISTSKSMFRSIMRMPQLSDNKPLVSLSPKPATVPEDGQVSPTPSPTPSPSPLRNALGVDSVAPSTPYSRTPLRTESEIRTRYTNGESQAAQATPTCSSFNLPALRPYSSVPMTEPPVPRPILKSALKMPASSALSASVAVTRFKKLAFVDENNSTAISDVRDRDVHQEATEGGHNWSAIYRCKELSSVRYSASPVKSVTFDSPDPSPETPKAKTCGKQPMAATAEEIYEQVDEMDTAEEIYSGNGMEDSKRASLAESISGQILAGAVFYVDVNSADGADAADIFIPLLTEMGATCVPRWQNSLDGITHVLFKDGHMKTLEKVAASRGTIKCVNIGWPLE